MNQLKFHEKHDYCVPVCKHNQSVLAGFPKRVFHPQFEKVSYRYDLDHEQCKILKSDMTNSKFGMYNAPSYALRPCILYDIVVESRNRHIDESLIYVMDHPDNYGDLIKYLEPPLEVETEEQLLAFCDDLFEHDPSIKIDPEIADGYFSILNLVKTKGILV